MRIITNVFCIIACFMVCINFVRKSYNLSALDVGQITSELSSIEYEQTLPIISNVSQDVILNKSILASITIWLNNVLIDLCNMLNLFISYMKYIYKFVIICFKLLLS